MNIVKKLIILFVAVIFVLQTFCYAKEKEDILVGPGFEDIQIAGDKRTGYPESVVSNGLMITPDFSDTITCSYKSNNGKTRYIFPKPNFNFINDPSKNAFVNEQYNFLLNYNMRKYFENNYSAANEGRIIRMKKVGLKTFDGNVIDLEFTSLDRKSGLSMRVVKTSYDIANNTLLIG